MELLVRISFPYKSKSLCKDLGNSTRQERLGKACVRLLCSRLMMMMTFMTVPEKTGIPMNCSKLIPHGGVCKPLNVDFHKL